MYEKYVAKSLVAAGKNAKETGKEREIKIKTISRFLYSEVVACLSPVKKPNNWQSKLILGKIR